MPPQDTQPTPQQPTQPAMPVQPTAQAPLSPLYQTDVWHTPDGHYTIFGYRDCVAVVYPGWLVVYRKSDHSEVRRIQLTPGIKMKYFLNYARFSEVNGQKIGIFSPQYIFFTTTIWSYSLFFVGVLINAIYRFATLGAYEDLGQQVLVQGIALLFMVASVGWMAMGIPKSKAFIAACKQAASIA